MIGVEGNDGLLGQLRQSCNALCAPGGTLIDRGFTLGDGLCIVATVGVAATGALRLRQGSIKAINQIIGHKEDSSRKTPPLHKNEAVAHG
jgi:hypothetical protein